ncbi:ribosomal RNA small subunit methyltransferase A, partial [Patescibacteria group bacterium]|nr:ribosomal RNA small subunit methyltransferase A [Patescibacteria group bacterium]
MDKDLFKPTKLKQLCEKYQLRPSKQYGQNFLISESVIEKIIKAGDLKKNDTVVEIGPGFGVLTFAMAPLVKRVIAFEIERRLDEYWQKNKSENVEIIWGDALKRLTAYGLRLKPGYKVVANLPYQITSQVLRVLLEQENKPESITVMVQKEVGERIVAKPGDMSLLALSVQYYGEPKIITKVSKGNFWPEPKVDSAVFTISKISRVSKFTDEEFFRIARAGFANKRKQL